MIGMIAVTTVFLWIIVLIAALIVAKILYVGARVLLVFTAPQVDARIDQFFISRDARRYLQFMFQRGYTMSDVKYVANQYGGWHFRLDSEDRHHSLIFDEQESVIVKLLSTENGTPHEISLDALIYYLTRGKRYVRHSFRVKSLSRRATLQEIAPRLKEFLPQIEKFASTQIQTKPEELSSYQSEFLARRSRDFSEWLAQPQD